MILFLLLAALGSTPAPESLGFVEIICDDQLSGVAAPISAATAVTAAHVIEGCQSLQWRTKFKSGPLRVLKQNVKEDWAFLMTEHSFFDQWILVAKKPPENGDRLWWYLMLPGEQPEEFPVSGTYIGEVGSDKQLGDPPGTRFMYIDGVFYPGSSGSPIVNAEGDLVGIGKGWYFRGPDKAPTRAIARAVPIRQVFR